MEKKLQQHVFNYEDFLPLLPKLKKKEWQWVEEKNILKNTHSSSLEIHLPIIFPKNTENLSWEEYITKIATVPCSYLVILMQAGQGAIGFFEEGELALHKVIRRYMVRKKQGKSQLSHLKTKGKSKLGSRIRLAQTEDFILTIQEKIKEWEVLPDTEKIFYSASQILWNKIFEGEKMPFTKEDERLVKIPKDLPMPTLEVLLEVQAFLQNSTLYGNWEEIEDFIANFSV